MIRFGLIAWLVVVAGTQSLDAQEGPTFKSLILPDAVRFVQVFSEDKRVGAMLFDNLILGTDGGIGVLPSAKTKKFTYVLHPQSDKEVCVVQSIRGFVSTQGTGSAMFVVHSGGKSTLVDFGKAIEAAKSNSVPKARQELRQKVKQKAKDGGLTVDGRPNKSEDFYIEIKTHAPAGSPLQTTFVMLVDRLPGVESAAAVHIDTIDFEVLPVVKK